MNREQRPLCLEEVPTAEMPEVLRVASELYAQDRAQIVQAEQRQEILQAASEVGLPAEYLERAAVLVQARRVKRRPRRRHRERLAMLSALGLALGIGLMYRERPAPPQPPPTPMVASAPGAAALLIGPCVEVDLSRHVTHRLDEPMLPTPGNNLASLATGTTPGGVPRRTVQGVPFRLDGVVVVGPGETRSGEGVSATVAPQVEGITIDRKARRLHFLHGTHWRARTGEKIGAYIVRYEDGTRLEIPIRYGVDVRDWWLASDRAEVPGAQVAWTGSNPASDRGIRLFMKSWPNPFPDRKIQSLDMVTGDQPAGRSAPAPFLVGVTAELGKAPVSTGHD